MSRKLAEFYFLRLRFNLAKKKKKNQAQCCWMLAESVPSELGLPWNSLDIRRCPHYQGQTTWPVSPVHENIFLLWHRERYDEYSEVDHICRSCGYGHTIDCILAYASPRMEPLFAAIKYGSGCASYGMGEFWAPLNFSNHLQDVIAQFPPSQSLHQQLAESQKMQDTIYTLLRAHVFPKEIVFLCLEYLFFSLTAPRK
jgi:hypothetical protein